MEKKRHIWFLVLLSILVSIISIVVFAAAPSVTLNSPSNNHVQNSNNIDLTCTGTDDMQLINLSFYHNITGSWTINKTITNLLLVVDVNADVWNSNRFGNSWTLIKDDYNGGSSDGATAMAIDNLSRILIVDGQTVWRSSDKGISWSIANVDFNPGNDNAGVMAADYKNYFYIIDVKEKVFKSTNFGSTWTEVNSDYNLGNNDAFGMTSNRSGALFVVDSGREVYVSIDEGSTWTRQTTNYGGGGNTIDDMGSDKNNNLYILDNANLWRSTNNGITWTNINSDFNGGSDVDNGVTITSDENGYLYILDDSEDVYRSINGGTTFNLALSNMNGGNGDVVSIVSIRDPGITINKVSLTESLNLTNLNDGSYKWNCLVYDNESLGVFGSNNFTFTIDRQKPATNLVSPPNNEILKVKNVNFTCSATDNYQLSNITLYNNITGSWIAQQTKDMTGTSNSTNFTVNNIADGTALIWNCLTYDQAKNFAWATNNFTLRISLDKPYWSNPVNQTPSIYNPNTLSHFNITWQDDFGVSHVFIENNFTGSFVNNSMNLIAGNVYNYSKVLGAGTYQWKSYANDTDGGFNVSNAYVFTINKAPSDLSLFLNETENNLTTIRTGYINITGVINTGDSVSIDLLENGTAFASGSSPLENIRQFNTKGLFNITVRYNESQNYLTSSKSFFVIVNDNNPSWANPINKTPQTYDPNTQSYFNITWTDDLSISQVYLEANFTGSFLNYTMNLITNNIYNYSQVLPAGAYSWKSYANDSNNQFNISEIYTFTINKATPNIDLFLNSIQNDITITEGDSVNHTGVIASGGDSQNLELLRDGVVFVSGPSPLENISIYNSAGTFNITVRYNETENYTSSFETWFITVNSPSSPPSSGGGSSGGGSGGGGGQNNEDNNDQGENENQRSPRRFPFNLIPEPIQELLNRNREEPNIGINTIDLEEKEDQTALGNLRSATGNAVGVLQGLPVRVNWMIIIVMVIISFLLWEHNKNNKKRFK